MTAMKSMLRSAVCTCGHGISAGSSRSIAAKAAILGHRTLQPSRLKHSHITRTAGVHSAANAAAEVLYTPPSLLRRHSAVNTIPYSRQQRARRYTSSAEPPEGPADEYAERVKAGQLRKDAHQLTVVEDLESLYRAVLEYDPPPVPEPLAESNASPRSGWMGRLFGDAVSTVPPLPEIPPDVPKSLYLYGDVGCGKTMLMDLFYESLPASVRKRRVHFHAFMMDVHKRLHRMASQQDGQTNKGDAIVPVARELARDGRMLCFDEFQVTDIADGRRELFTLTHRLTVPAVISNDTKTPTGSAHRLWLRGGHNVKVKLLRVSCLIRTV